MRKFYGNTFKCKICDTCGRSDQTDIFASLNYLPIHIPSDTLSAYGEIYHHNILPIQVATLYIVLKLSQPNGDN